MDGKLVPETVIHYFGEPTNDIEEFIAGIRHEPTGRMVCVSCHGWNCWHGWHESCDIRGCECTRGSADLTQDD